MSLIEKIYAREVLDSRGCPTVEVEVKTLKNVVRAQVPSGASKGSKECAELRDQELRFNGMGVLKAVGNVNKIIAPKLVNTEVADQKNIDQTMIDLDGTEDKSVLGGNAILGVSLACLKGASKDANIPCFQYIGDKFNKNKNLKMPQPLMNFINGGKHASNSLDVQEFMLVPKFKTFSESLRAGAEIFWRLKQLLNEKKNSTNVGDEGGFAPNLSSNRQALELLLEAVEKASYIPGENVFLSLDVASNELYDSGKYLWEGKKILSDELVKVYEDLCRDFPMFSIEDPFYEGDLDAWKEITNSLGKRVQVIGDDLYATNPSRIKTGISKKLSNSVLIKCNQIGTFSETLEALNLAKRNNFKTTMSHRSGDTEDHLISDLAVGLGCDQIKTGGLCRSERIAKYNQLLRIEEKLDDML